MTGVLFIIWLAGVGLIRFVLMHYFGYLVKAGHVAVISEAVVTGKIPKDQVNYGKNKVQERFVTSNVFFGLDSLVSGAVRQIQKTVNNVADFLDFIPGIKNVAGLANFFISIFLGYVDECCLGYVFYINEEGDYKSAADGVVIYAQNWKQLLKDASKTMIGVVLLMVVIVVVAFIPIGIVFRVLNWSGLVAFLIACFVAWAIKFAFIDSFILVSMMSSYMKMAPNTVITFDLYQKLSGVSSKFKSLVDQSKKEEPVGYRSKSSAVSET